MVFWMVLSAKDNNRAGNGENECMYAGDRLHF